MKIVTVVGARPQFIKASALSREFMSRGIDEVIVHTGQHYDQNMSDVFFIELGIPKPKYSLEVKSNLHGEMTGKMLEQIEKILLTEKPDCVVVYGDTNSTIAGALAASKIHIPIAHVEAGLRSFNRKMPEEVNRVVTDHLSNFLFAPTELAQNNLAKEGISSAKSWVVGDIMYDVARYFGDKAEAESLLKDYGVVAKNYVLATCHRQENTNDGSRLKAIFEGLSSVAQTVPVVCPLHPRTRKYLSESSWFKPNDSLKLVDPLGYKDMVALQKNAKVIATDSGGVQKEAYFYRVPCVTFRDETEWVELVDSGWNVLIPPTDANSLKNAILGSMNRQGQNIELYGDGFTAKKIADIIVSRV